MGAESEGGQRRTLGHAAFNLRSEGRADIAWVKGEVFSRGNSICKGPGVRNKKLRGMNATQSEAGHGVT